MTGPLVTRTSLIEDLRREGLKEGMILCVHVSLSRLGFVVGGGRVVIDALVQVVGQGGSIMMPTFSGELSDPAEWKHPSVPSEWIPRIRDEMPPYDPALTPTRNMGVVPELFRHYPGVQRSPHPQSSFCAWGSHARALVADHPLNNRFGPTSPLGALVRHGGASLLLGAAPNTNSLLYLSTFGLERRTAIRKSAPMLAEGKATWVPYDDVEYTNHWFDDLAAHLRALGIARCFKVGAADCWLFPARETIAEATRWRRERNV